MAGVVMAEAGEAGALRGMHVHVSTESGVAGDMMLGALIDVGVPEGVIEAAMEAVGVGGRMVVARVVKGGIAAVDVKIRIEDEHEHEDAGIAHAHEHVHEHDGTAHEHGHGHGGGHGHTTYVEIVRRLEGAALEADVKARALDVFARIARAEATLHGTTVERVAFHEVGAIDSIADVVGAAAGLAWLAPASVSATTVAMGQGSVRSAHGRLPVPSPAALEILREVGAPVKGGGCDRELTTPTGAAILAHAVTAWGGMPAIVPLAIGHGAGDRELTDRPNVVRLVVGRPAEADAGLWRVEANVDDMSPELCEHVAAQIFAAGALDAWWTPIVMKKSRPAVLLAALAPSAARAAVVDAILRETTSIGVRWDPVERIALPREVVVVATPYGQVPVKLARQGERVVNAAPEYEACRAVAVARGVPLKEVFAAAAAAARSLGPALTPPGAGHPGASTAPEGPASPPSGAGHPGASTAPGPGAGG